MKTIGRVFKKVKSYVKNTNKEVKTELTDGILNIHENIINNSKLPEKYSDLKMEYYQLLYQNQVLRKRLFMCKRDTKIRNQRYNNLIAFLLQDKNNTLRVRTKEDILWDCDRFIWRILASIVEAYFSHNLHSLPSDLSEEEFERRKELMIKACIYKSEQMELQTQIIKPENEAEIKQGVQYLIEYLPHMWL